MTTSALPDTTTQAELQDDVMRFEGRFADRLRHVLAPLEASGSPAARRSALERELAWLSAALDIAAGDNPVANLLDMLTFVELSSERFEEHWRPNVFGDSGRPVEEALQDAVEDIREVAAKYMTPSQTARFARVLADWREANPEQIHVETVRLSAFSPLAGARVQQSQDAARGLLGDMRRGMQTAESARLLGDRALYLGRRLPQLLGLHARVVADDLFSDLKQNLLDSRYQADAAARHVELATTRVMARGGLVLCGVSLFVGLVVSAVKLVR
ncbi:hypothetical protein [Pyxidicoccus sp. MSG2]|uniref:hypothetical protein n=1 Tax=Pyxidicoccus sp. MSG2 TaxID=2996790 RepID=UPI0022722341|nr:hypothetical protein [Pyxidicoccus sp. MSG2]MCY1023484.1 hypothetical protein [Pyxidicoccus sp. MSG2]